MKPVREAQCKDPDTFPAPIDNRAGLARIAYRIGTYAEARRHILRRIDADPTLAAWTYRGSDDPGIALYESAALLVDTLTLYQDVYANEAFLRTATWRESVADLVRLTGYRLDPGAGGLATFAFELRGDAAVPLPAGVTVTADLADNPDTATFQTASAATALPWLSRFPLLRPQLPAPIASGARQLIIQDPARTVAADDRLLVGVPSSDGLDPWEIAIVESVEQWHGRALITLKGPISNTGGTTRYGLRAYKLGRTFHHFGHNAPSQRIELGSDSKPVPYSVGLDRDFTANPDNGGEGANAFPALAPADVLLDPQATDLALGTQLAIQTFIPGRRIWIDIHGRPPQLVDIPPKQVLAVRTIESLRQVTARWGALAGPATLAGLDATPIARSTDLRDIVIDTLEGEPFEVGVPWQDAPAPRGSTLAWWGDAGQAQTLKGREVAFLPAGAPPYTALVTDVQTAQPADLSIVFLDREVSYSDFPSTGTPTDVLGNLVHATQGERQDETVLGNGDDQVTFQTFKLPKDPLTYLTHPELTPPMRPEIAIVVGDRIWTYVATLYGQAADARVFTVRQDNSGASWIQFGDGKTGSRLPSGVDNVRVRWRTGIAAFGGLKPGASPSLSTRIDAVKQVDLPTPVTGGAAPEAMDVARTAAPARVQSLDRLVSLADVEAETLALAGVERARATWNIAGGVPCIAVTVLMQERRSADIEAVRASLATANRRRGPSRHPIVVAEGAFEYLYLSATIASDPARDVAAIRSDVDAALDALFATHSFGDAEYAVRVEGALQNIDGVRWVVIDALGSLGIADDPDTLVFPPAPSRAEVVPCPADHVLRIHHPAVRVQIVPQGADA